MGSVSSCARFGMDPRDKPEGDKLREPTVRVGTLDSRSWRAAKEEFAGHFGACTSFSPVLPLCHSHMGDLPKIHPSSNVDKGTVPAHSPSRCGEWPGVAVGIVRYTSWLHGTASPGAYPNRRSAPVSPQGGGGATSSFAK